MVEKGFIKLLAQLARRTFGNTSMQKLCFHSLVRIITELDDERMSFHSCIYNIYSYFFYIRISTFFFFFFF